MSNQLSTSIKPLPDTWIDALFTKMLGMYGNKFSDMWRDTDIRVLKSVWANELGKLNRDQLAAGANALYGLDWPPSLPQFIRLCKPTINFQAAYYEALSGVYARKKGEIGTWSNPAIYWAMVKVGAFDIENLTYQQISGRWENALQGELDKGAWEHIPKPAIALPAPDTQATKAIADQYLAGTKVMKKEDSKVDHKLWAKRILERIAANDKTVTHIQKQFAQEAMK